MFDLIASTILEEGNYVIIYSDGGGADVIHINTKGLPFNADGEAMNPENLDDYLFVAKLPDNFKLWYQHV